MENTWHGSAPHRTQLNISHYYALSKIIAPKCLSCLSQLVGLNLGVPCQWRGGIKNSLVGGHTQANLWPQHFAFPNLSVNFHSCLKAPQLCRCCTATGTAGNGIVIPTHATTHPPIPAPLGTALPLPSSPREGKGSFNSSFPSGTLFFFPPPLDLGCGNNIQRAEKVLSIFFPSCRHQKGIVGSIRDYIMAGFDPLSRGDIDLLPFLSLFGCRFFPVF